MEKKMTKEEKNSEAKEMVELKVIVDSAQQENLLSDVINPKSYITKLRSIGIFPRAKTVGEKGGGSKKLYPKQEALFVLRKVSEWRAEGDTFSALVNRYPIEILKQYLEVISQITNKSKIGKIINMIHSIRDEETCTQICKTNCLTRKLSFQKSEFIENQKDCSQCKCFCK